MPVFPRDGAREGKQFVDEAGHLLDFLAQIFEAGLLAVVGALFKNAERDLDAGDGRTEFVGDVAKETFLAGDEPGEAAGHLVNRAAERAEFVPAMDLGADIEMALGDFFGGGGHLGKGTGDAAYERDPEQGGDENDGGDAGNDPGRRVEEQAAGAQRGGGYNEIRRQGYGGRQFASLAGAGEDGHDDPIMAGVMDHESWGLPAALHGRPAFAAGWGREVGGIRTLLGRWFLTRTVSAVRATTTRTARLVHAGARHHAVAHGGREFNGFAGELLELAMVIMEQIKFYAMLVAEFLEDIIPFRAGMGGEFRGDEAGDVLERFAGGAGDEGIPAETELDAGDDEKSGAEEGDVQKKPEQDFQVEGKSGFHGLKAG